MDVFYVFCYTLFVNQKNTSTFRSTSLYSMLSVVYWEYADISRLNMTMYF